MSFDVYLQDFSDAPADRSVSVGKLVLGPMLDTGGARVVTADGSADVYGASEMPLHSLMFTRIAGELAWNVIFDAAVAGDWVVLPIGGRVCIVRDDQAASIPEDLAVDGHVLVSSGRELRAAATEDISRPLPPAASELGAG
ncbi:hypothetical protein ACFCVO_12270 [Agromyces sp. NPDC056379]|uniref:hypothetical protein n=1 Tax=unclassified Agromyces TaxID=2639701 RepID=UPI0035DE1492